MATKVEVKQSKKEIIDKIIKTCEYLIIPIGVICGIWGFDITVYASAFLGIVVSILTFIKLFIKD